MRQTPKPVRRWCTLYYLDGCKSFRKLEHSTKDRPIAAAVDFIGLDLLVPGFDFSYEYRSGVWHKKPTSAHVPLLSTVMGHSSETRAKYLYWLYKCMPTVFAKEISFSEAPCGEISIAVQDVEAFWA